MHLRKEEMSAGGVRQAITGFARTARPLVVVAMLAMLASACAGDGNAYPGYSKRAYPRSEIKNMVVQEAVRMRVPISLFGIPGSMCASAFIFSEGCSTATVAALIWRFPITTAGPK
jgi:hypothetical protein